MQLQILWWYMGANNQLFIATAEPLVIGAGSGPAGPARANCLINIHKCIYNIYVYSCEIQGTLQDQLVSTTNPSSMYYVHARTRTSLLPRSDATCNALYGVMAQPDLVLPDSGLAQTNSYIW